jgi:A/G-specific adenine glycosylase
MPWRGLRDPYAIWVSEVMLQQTQVSTVIPYFERWMARFPDVSALAAADENEVLLAWEGLGYYRRARNLQRAARQIVSVHGGQLPRDPEQFAALSGVGPYTVAAVSSIAFGEALAVLDGNVKRVLARLIALDDAVDRPQTVKSLQVLADQLLCGDPSTHNQAMMELGAMLCLPRRPHCDVCPLRTVCAAHLTAQPQDYPRKTKRAAVPHHHLAVALVQRGDAILLYRRPYDGMLAGLWDLPMRRLDVDDPSAGALGLARDLVREMVGLAPQSGEPLQRVRHTYTHLKVTLHPVRFQVPHRTTVARRAAEQSDYRWLEAAALAQHPLPRATQKVLGQI